MQSGRHGHRAAEVQHPAARPDGLRQDAARADARAHPQRPVRDRRRHGADRGRLRRRGRREHPPQADPGRGLRRQEGRDGDHLHRRGRQDRAQGGQPVDHARRVRRGRPAGAAEDPRGDDGVACRPQGGRKHPHQEFLTIDTTNVLFICGGAFADLDKVIERRIGHKGIGFGAAITAKHDKDLGEIFEECLPEDLMQYGLIPEFIGRLPVASAVHQLSRGRPDHDPDRAAQRDRQAVPALLLLRRHRARLHRRRPEGRRRTRPSSARPAPAACARSSRRSSSRCSSSCRPAATSRSASSPRRRSSRASRPTLVTAAAEDDDTGEQAAESA